MIMHAIGPDMGLLILTISGLLIGLWVPEQRLLTWHRWMMLGLLGIGWMIVQGLSLEPTLWFHGHLVHDGLASASKLAVTILMLFVLYYAQPYAAAQHLFKLEWTLLHLFMLQGMYVLVSAHSLLTIYLGLQLMSLPLYALIAMSRNALAIEAALKYFITGGVASAMLLYGMSFFYGYLGHIDLPSLMQHASSQGEVGWMVVAMIFVMAGLLFKLAAVPFHMWAPDVYEGAPWSVTLLVATVPKLAVFSVLLRLLVEVLPEYHSYWHEWLLAVAILSITLGNMVAMMQQNIKRLLAYSAIAQMGYGLLALVPGTSIGYAAALFYLVSYLLATLAGMGCLVLISRPNRDAIDDLKALSQRDAMLALTLLVVVFSLIGVPPLVGFLGKLFVIQALLAAGYIKVAIYALLMALVGAYYYLKIIKVMYFEQATTLVPIVRSAHHYVLAGNGLLCLWLGLFPAGLYLCCQHVVQNI